MRKLFRSSSNRVVAGVCGGLGEYLSIDPVIVRIIWILLLFFDCVGLVLYIIAWIIIPSEIKGVSEELKENKSKIETSSKKNSAYLIIGITLVLLGVIFIARNYWVHDYIMYYLQFIYNFIVPLGLIALGIFLIFKKK
ncbi:MAG: PspC domain-containing protein [Candidatus Marinimicrobia bacterium]|nr:PspC domain-containing protein [Candidatus Neomarinimicrobiota bacterium]